MSVAQGDAPPDLHIAIIGLGPWGLAALDRFVTAARRRPGARIKVTAVDAAPPGPGVHDPADSALLLLNTAAGQVDSFGAAHFGEPPLPGALAFLTWARRNGCPGATGDSFLPRVVFGRYLAFAFAVLREAAPANLELVVLRDQVMAIEQCPGSRARLLLRDGDDVTVDRAVLCTGHGVSRAAAVPTRAATASGAPVPAPLRPYPVARLDAEVGDARSVGIAGLGLVAVDVVAALTEGRGGRFERNTDGRLVYHASGREPWLFPFSRSGIPFSCRPATTLDLATRYEPVHCTPERVAALRSRAGLDLVGDVLAPVFAEMRAAYALRTLELTHGVAAAEGLRRRLRAADLEQAHAIVERDVPEAAAFRPDQLVLVERLCPAGGQLGHPAGIPDEASGVTSSPSSIASNRAAVASGPPSGLSTGADDLAHVRDTFTRRLAFDVAEARKGEAFSPYKTGLEILRVVRHVVRAGVEHGRLAPASRALFHRVVAPRIAQLIVGPPVSRGEEWLALIDAGIIRLDFVQAPEISRNWTRSRWRAVVRGAGVAASTHLDHLVLGHLEDEAPAAAGDGLWQRLYADGVCSVVRDGARVALRIDREGHLIDATGQIVPTVQAFGVPTEGATYFNHYLPSPRSRAGAFERLHDMIEGLLDGDAGRTAAMRLDRSIDRTHHADRPERMRVSTIGRGG